MSEFGPRFTPEEVRREAEETAKKKELSRTGERSIQGKRSPEIRPPTVEQTERRHNREVTTEIESGTGRHPSGDQAGITDDSRMTGDAASDDHTTDDDTTNDDDQ